MIKMRINSNYNGQETSYAGVAGKPQDAYSKGIQSQIANVQKQLQSLSSREGMSPEEKMKKRQELQRQINDLNNQLRQHEIEQRKERQKQKTEGGSMEAMISADAAMNQAQVQNSVATDIEGSARILKSEIRQDAARGGDTSDKQEALAELEERAANATAAQMDILESVDKEMKESENGGTQETDKEKVEKTAQEKTENSSQDAFVDVFV